MESLGPGERIPACPPAGLELTLLHTRESYKYVVNRSWYP